MKDEIAYQILKELETLNETFKDLINVLESGK